MLLKMARAALTPLAVAAVAGCGSAADAPPSSSTIAIASTPQASPPARAPRTAKGKTTACIRKFGFDVHPAGNATRVDSAGGRPVANITFHGSAAAAVAFDAQLEIPLHDVHGKSVAIYLDGAKDIERPVIRECLM